MHPLELRRAALGLLETGLSLNAVSKLLGVSRAALREWRELPDLRGRARAPVCPRGCDGGGVEPASPPADYAALLGFYLGDGCLSAAKTHFVLRVSCDATYPGIIADVTERVERVHPGVCHVPAPGVTVVQNAWKHWPCLFPQHGPGRKHERVLGMQPWQWAIIEEHPGAFLRGLFHSDGARVKNWATRMVAGERKRYDYPRWQFVNASEEILGWCGDALDLAGVAWRRSGPRTISVSTRAGVARLDELVGPKT